MTEVAEVKTIGDVERIVHGSGMWDGTGPVEFSNDGDRWVEAWAPTEEHPHPVFARVEVHRKDVTIPKRKTIRWDDYVPRGDGERSIFWLAQWTASPSRHFDRITRMVNYREMFRDIIGDIIIDGEDVDHEPAPAAEAPGRDWAAEINAATTLDELDAVNVAARAVKAFTPDATGTALHRQLRAKHKTLTEAAASAWDPTPDTANERTASGARRTTAAEHGAPRDYLAPSGNRASRRAKKKRGGRR